MFMGIRFRYAVMALAVTTAEASILEGTENPSGAMIRAGPASTMDVSATQLRVPAINNIHGVADNGAKTNTAKGASDLLAQFPNCIKDFEPFPETGPQVRNRFIVDLAYEMGCEHT